MQLSELNPTRPWPLPQAPWIMSQQWRDITFVHYAMDPKMLSSFIPKGLELDTYHDQAWISIVVLQVHHLRLRFMPPIPGVLNFNQINIRTYVQSSEGKPGVYFLHIGATSRLAVFGASTFMHMPFVHADLRIDPMPPDKPQLSHPSVQRIDCSLSDHTKLRLRTAPVSSPYPAVTNPLTKWLTERYCQYSDSLHPVPLQAKGAVGSELLITDIQHKPWSVQTAKVSVEQNSLLQPFGIVLPSSPHLVTLTKKLQAYIWGQRPVKPIR
ncbi:DUF2071 domain-containing protein [Paenibacillus terrigena]|uniref:YqjF family protein n=1 Tax=Paenibacillus terrigena TaxID=369333 RepID=UPI0028D22940|nr:DUF2071 domain-containing protein [Paenibacillus terrigena]